MKLSVLEKELKKQAAEIFGLSAEQTEGFVLSVPPSHISAHISIAWPISSAKILRRPPAKIAAELAEKLRGPFTAEAIPPGFVNLRLDDGFLLGEAVKLMEKEYFSEEENRRAGKINLEFVSANPTGPMHLASGRGATLGDSLARIMRASGYKVETEFYVNDAGHQVAMLGESLKARYNKQEPPENGYHGDYLVDMAAELPPEASGWEVKRFSDYAVNKMLARHKADMEAFGVRFSRWFLETDLHKAKAPEKALAELEKRGAAYKKDGAVWFGSSSELKSDDKDRVLVKQDGSNTYFLNDIAYHLNKFSRGFSTLIDIWGADHHGYVPRLEAALKVLAGENETFRVIIHQQVALKRGEAVIKMSKRSGEFISLKDLTEEVGTDACRFFFASRGPNTHLNFDVDLAKRRSNDNPVFYVQYVHARICSIFAKAAECGMTADNFDAGGAELNDEERLLLVKLLWFEKVLKDCLRDFSPHHITTYLTELAALFHSFYDKYKVVDEDNRKVSEQRLYILKAVGSLLSSALSLLGVSAPDRM